MSNLVPPDKNRCVPFHIGSGGNETGSRIGGRGPLGVVAPHRDATTRYFGTIVLSSHPIREMTVYTSFDFETMAANRGVLGSSNLVQVLFHQETIRGDWTPESSGLSEHPLRIGETADDWFEDDGERIIESGHKFGGRPYLTRPNPTLEEQIRLIEDGGFVHVLQIDFPGGGEDAIVDGDWPFGTGMFHVFAQPPFNNPRCYWLWEW